MTLQKAKSSAARKLAAKRRGESARKLAVKKQQPQSEQSKKPAENSSTDEPKDSAVVAKYLNKKEARKHAAKARQKRQQKQERRAARKKERKEARKLARQQQQQHSEPNEPNEPVDDPRPKVLIRLKKKSPESERSADFDETVVAMDCEFVGVGPLGATDALARASVVDYDGRVLYDSYCRPPEAVVDFRTEVSGVTPRHLKKAPSFKQVQREVQKVLQDKVVVGHGLSSDYSALMLTRDRLKIRDTSLYSGLRDPAHPRRVPKLAHLAHKHLGITIQQGTHCSIQDARAALGLYKLHRKQWDAELRRRLQMRQNKIKKRRGQTHKMFELTDQELYG
ncbi:MAG: hypothetical protein MHM6MM_001112 [Cercozoa sp. M6MM]